MTLLAQKVIFIINIWFNSVFNSFFEQDQLLNLIILGFMERDYLNLLAFQNKNWCSPKSDRGFFFSLRLSEDLSIGRILGEKNGYGKGLIFEKTEALYAELNKRAEAAISSYSVADDFLQYICSVPVTKNHENISSRCLVHEFSFTDIFNDINHG